MNNSDLLAFAGSDLDRAGHLRAQPQEIEKLRNHPEARVVLFWNFNPLIDKSGAVHLLRLPLTHPVVVQYAETFLFLGQEKTGPCFACDLAHWSPENVEAVGGTAFFDQSEHHHPALPETQVFTDLRHVLTCLDPRDAELAATGRAMLLWHKTHGYCAKCGAASDISHGGWQRDCPSCQTSHFPRTDPVVIMLITYQDQVLLGRSAGWPEGMYSLLAGFVEPGETLEAAVRREVFEEAGVRVGGVSYLCAQPWPFPASLMLGCAGHALSFDITIDPVEIEDARWVSRPQLMEAIATKDPTLVPARQGSIAHYLLINWLADRVK